MLRRAAAKRPRSHNRPARPGGTCSGTPLTTIVPNREITFCPGLFFVIGGDIGGGDHRQLTTRKL